METLKLIFLALGKDKIKTTLLILTIVVGIIFLIWRLLFTFSWANTILSISWGLVLYLADVYGFFTFLIFAFETLYIVDLQKDYKITDPKSDYFPSVDIFICTYNEDPDIVRKTAIGCSYINYQNKKVYILDDKRRDAIKEIAEELNINYITRPTNEHFKAGNINNALGITNGDLIVNFDADHVPNECFLEVLVKYFQDESVALIQTPQHFFNPDPFQKTINFGGMLVNEQDLFFRVIQPGLCYWNAVICCGTNWIARRSALAEVGNIPVNTITEDMATSIKLQERKYKTLYLNKPIAAGLSAETLSEYLYQRQRWGIGALQIFFSNLSPLKNKKLSIAQKICYLGALNYYFLGIPRLIYLMAPCLYIMFNFYGCVATLNQLLVFQVPYLILLIGTFMYISKGYRVPIITDTYEATVAYDLTLVAINAVFTPWKKSKFRVTKKNLTINKSYYDFYSVMPQWIMFFILLFNMALVLYYYFYNPEARAHEALLINAFWVLYNLIILGISLKVGLELPQRRKHTRIDMVRTFELHIGKSKCLVNTLNLSEGGALLEVEPHGIDVDKNQDVQLVCYDKFETISVDAKVLETKLSRKKDKQYVRIQFQATNSEQEKIIIRQIYSFCRRWE